MSFDWKKHSTGFTFTKEQIVRLAGWYKANKPYGHEFSTSIMFALAPADENEDAIWPNATIETVPNIVGMIENIRRVDNGDREFWTWQCPKKTDALNEPTYIHYVGENWIREGLGLGHDDSLDIPRKFVPDYILDMREEEC